MPESKKILVVDDDATVRDFVYYALKAMGHIVFRAGDVSEVFAIIRDLKTVDLVITDYSIDDRYGTDVLERVRAQSFPCKVVLMTTMLAEDRERFEKMGFDDLLNKPFDLSELTDVIRKHLD
jgi:DNA-binding response OmpR family regulator